jgi:prolipoprotein diacylglyceryltransferase
MINSNQRKDMQQRPIAVTIFGILNIGFGVIGLLGMLVSMAVLSRTNVAANPILQEMYDNPNYIAWTKISMPLGGIAAVVLISAGIGLLLLKNWARLVSIGYGVYAILGGIVGGLVMLNIFASILRHNAGGPSGFVVMFSLLGSIFGMVIGLAYPILLIIFMTRPKVVAAFGLPQPVK